jgi:hypothetical protein
MIEERLCAGRNDVASNDTLSFMMLKSMTAAPQRMMRLLATVCQFILRASFNEICSCARPCA